MANPIVTLKNGPRPAGKPDECFYCRRKIGKHHTDECVLTTKIVSITFNVMLDVEVPRHWTKEEIDSYYNESHWCAGNLTNLIEEHFKLNSTSCLCDCCSAKLMSWM